MKRPCTNLVYTEALHLKGIPEIVLYRSGYSYHQGSCRVEERLAFNAVEAAVYFGGSGIGGLGWSCGLASQGMEPRDLQLLD